MADKVFHTNANGMGNELRDWSVEKLAATPSALYAGRFWQNTTDNSLYYSPDGTVVVRLSTLNDVETRTRFVGVLNLATGAIPLITPIADINAETSWDAGDFGCVDVGGTLAPIPGFGNETAAVSADIGSSFLITQTTTGINYLIPAPTNPVVGHDFWSDGIN